MENYKIATKITISNSFNKQPMKQLDSSWLSGFCTLKSNLPKHLSMVSSKTSLWMKHLKKKKMLNLKNIQVSTNLLVVIFKWKSELKCLLVLWQVRYIRQRLEQELRISFWYNLICFNFLNDITEEWSNSTVTLSAHTRHFYTPHIESISMNRFHLLFETVFTQQSFSWHLSLVHYQRVFILCCF